MAIDIIQFIASFQEHEQIDQEATGSCMYPSGLGMSSFAGLFGAKVSVENNLSPNRKRVAPNWLSGPARRSEIRIEEIKEAQNRMEPIQEAITTTSEIETHEEESNSDNFLATMSKSFSIGEEETNEKTQTRSWKREAGRQRRSNRRVVMDERQSSRPQHDFL